MPVSVKSGLLKSVSLAIVNGHSLIGWLESHVVSRALTVILSLHSSVSQLLIPLCSRPVGDVVSKRKQFSSAFNNLTEGSQLKAYCTKVD